MSGGVHVQAVQASVIAVIAEAAIYEDSAISPGRAAPNGIPARIIESAEHRLDAPLRKASDDALYARHQFTCAAAREHVIVAALHDSIWKFFWGAVSINFEKRWQSLQADTGLYAVRS
jgi:hypothetical protein